MIAFTRNTSLRGVVATRQSIKETHPSESRDPSLRWDVSETVLMTDRDKDKK